MTPFCPVPVVLNLSTTLELSIAPFFDEALLAWVPCGAEVADNDELPAIPAGMTCFLIAMYAPHRADEPAGELEDGRPLTAE